MANLVYNYAKVGFAAGTEDWDTLTYKVMLVTNVYVADPDDQFVSSATADELTGPGYVAGYGNAGRHTLLGCTVTVDLVNNRARLTANNPVWLACGPAGTAAAIIVIREFGGADATSPLICYIDGGFPVITNGGDLTVQWDAVGVMTLT